MELAEGRRLGHVRSQLHRYGAVDLGYTLGCGRGVTCKSSILGDRAGVPAQELGIEGAVDTASTVADCI